MPVSCLHYPKTPDCTHTDPRRPITFNGKDFPEDVLEQYNLEAIDPDDFISDLLDLNAGKVLEAAANHRRSLKRPSMTADQYLDMLLRQKLTRTEAFLRPLKMAL